MDACPPPQVWVDFKPGSPWEAHLEACPSCRAELSALAEAGAEPARRSLVPYAAAAALLLAAVLWRGSEPPPAPPAAAPPAAPGPVLAERSVGRTGIVVGGRGRLEGLTFVLEEGEAWVESEGDPVRVRVRGWLFELVEGAASFGGEGARVSLWMREAWGAEAPPVRVARGRVRILEGAGAGTDLLPREGSATDPRGWRPLVSGSIQLKDAVRGLPIPEAQARWSLEILVRKREASAEAALVFPAGGGLWEAPLGTYLPTEGWVRIRLDISPEQVRLLAGDREYFSCPPDRLGGKIGALKQAGGPAFRAWGGNLELAQARWRP